MQTQHTHTQIIRSLEEQKQGLEHKNYLMETKPKEEKEFDWGIERPLAQQIIDSIVPHLFRSIPELIDEMVRLNKPYADGKIDIEINRHNNVKQKLFYGVKYDGADLDFLQQIRKEPYVWGAMLLCPQKDLMRGNPRGPIAYGTGVASDSETPGPILMYYQAKDFDEELFLGGFSSNVKNIPKGTDIRQWFQDGAPGVGRGPDEDKNKRKTTGKNSLRFLMASWGHLETNNGIVSFVFNDPDMPPLDANGLVIFDDEPYLRTEADKKIKYLTYTFVDHKGVVHAFDKQHVENEIKKHANTKEKHSLVVLADDLPHVYMALSKQKDEIVKQLKNENTEDKNEKMKSLNIVQVQDLISERTQARAESKLEQARSISTVLAQMSVVLEDGVDGNTTWDIAEKYFLGKDVERAKPRKTEEEMAANADKHQRFMASVYNTYARLKLENINNPEFLKDPVMFDYKLLEKVILQSIKVYKTASGKSKDNLMRVRFLLTRHAHTKIIRWSSKFNKAVLAPKHLDARGRRPDNKIDLSNVSHMAVTEGSAAKVQLGVTFIEILQQLNFKWVSKNLVENVFYPIFLQYNQTNWQTPFPTEAYRFVTTLFFIQSLLSDNLFDLNFYFMRKEPDGDDKLSSLRTLEGLQEVAKQILDVNHLRKAIRLNDFFSIISVLNYIHPEKLSKYSAIEAAKLTPWLNEILIKRCVATAQMIGKGENKENLTAEEFLAKFREAAQSEDFSSFFTMEGILTNISPQIFAQYKAPELAELKNGLQNKSSQILQQLQCKIAASQLFKVEIVGGSKPSVQDMLDDMQLNTLDDGIARQDLTLIKQTLNKISIESIYVELDPKDSSLIRNDRIDNIIKIALAQKAFDVLSFIERELGCFGQTRYSTTSLTTHIDNAAYIEMRNDPARSMEAASYKFAAQYAADMEDWDCVLEIAKHKKNSPYNAGLDYALVRAAQCSQWEVVKELISTYKVTNVDKKVDGKSVIHYAALAHRLDIIKLLNENNADLDSLDTSEVKQEKLPIEMLELLRNQGKIGYFESRFGANPEYNSVMELARNGSWYNLIGVFKEEEIQLLLNDTSRTDALVQYAQKKKEAVQQQIGDYFNNCLENKEIGKIQGIDEIKKAIADHEWNKIIKLLKQKCTPAQLRQPKIQEILDTAKIMATNNWTALPKKALEHLKGTTIAADAFLITVAESSELIAYLEKQSVKKEPVQVLAIEAIEASRKDKQLGKTLWERVLQLLPRSNYKGDVLLSASQAEDWDKVKSLIFPVDPNPPICRSEEDFKYLYKNTACNEFAFLPITFAARAGKLDIVKQMIELCPSLLRMRYIDRDHPTTRYFTAFDVALQAGHDGIAQYLENKAVEALINEIKNTNNRNPLDTVKALLAIYPNIVTKQFSNQDIKLTTPLEFARSKNLTIFKCLSDHQTDLTRRAAAPDMKSDDEDLVRKKARRPYQSTLGADVSEESNISALIANSAVATSSHPPSKQPQSAAESSLCKGCNLM